MRPLFNQYLLELIVVESPERAVFWGQNVIQLIDRQVLIGFGVEGILSGDRRKMVTEFLSGLVYAFCRNPFHDIVYVGDGLLKKRSHQILVMEFLINAGSHHLRDRDLGRSFRG